MGKPFEAGLLSDLPVLKLIFTREYEGAVFSPIAIIPENGAENMTAISVISAFLITECENFLETHDPKCKCQAWYLAKLTLESLKQAIKEVSNGGSKLDTRGN